MVLFASHTHLFRGARLRGDPADVVAATPVQVAFSDGTEVDALLEPWEATASCSASLPTPRRRALPST